MLVHVFDWTFIFVVLINDFLNFLPSLLLFGSYVFILYRLGCEVSPYFLEIIFGKNTFLTITKSRHFFAIYLVILFTAIALGSPPTLNLVSIPEISSAALIISLLVGGALFTYFLTKEMLRQSDLDEFTGPIPKFWSRVEGTEKNDDYRKRWKIMRDMPSGITKKLSTVIWTYAPASSIVFLALILAWLFHSTLYFSLILDAILITWLVSAFISRFGLTFISKKLRADTEKAIAQSLFSGYHHFGPKTIFVTICLMSFLIAIIFNAHPFIVLCLALPSALGDMETLGATSFVIILFIPLVTYQLYFWLMLIKRSSVFLRVWQGQSKSLVGKVKTLPHWAIALFVITWYPLITQEFLLGHRFYPHMGKLSLSFLFSLSFKDFVSIFVFAVLSVAHALSLFKLVRRKETGVTMREILLDNILYGLVSLALWTSSALIWILTQASFPGTALFSLYLTVTFFYLPDLARRIEQKFARGSWIRRLLYYGSPMASIALAFTLGVTFSILDTPFFFTSLAVLFAIFMFFIWFDMKAAKFEFRHP